MARLTAAALLLSIWPIVGNAAGLEAKIIASLQAQGYTIVESNYTFLGRLRLIVENGEYHREMVFNPGTGEVLRDYALPLRVYLARQNAETGDSEKRGNDDDDGAAISATAVPEAESAGGADQIIIPEPVVP